MIQVKKTSIITLAISAAFLLANTASFADYSQAQNNVDDKWTKRLQQEQKEKEVINF